MIEKWNQCFTQQKSELFNDIGLLILRVAFGLAMAFGHGLGKMQNFFAGNIQFADPIGIGVAPSLFLAGFSEFVCAILIALGLLTRLNALPLIFTMLVAAFVVHGADPFQKQEMSLIYLAAYITIFLCGPGKFSLDKKLNIR